MLASLHTSRRGLLFAAGTVISLAAATTAAQAHVKWFAPYIVGAAPQPIMSTLVNTWFWVGIVLVLVFFGLTRAIERSQYGAMALDVLDRATEPLWPRLDDYMRAIIGAFFIAIFAVGGVYLTPDLKTPAEWVSWLQLVIAGMIFSRRTMPIAGLGIVALWVLALRDYDLFHLFDYLALGLGVAGYLILEPSKRENWRVHRFEALRWGLAIALMWSSLEKFAFPVVLSARCRKTLPDVRFAARCLHPDGGRHRIHAGAWPRLDTADPPSLGDRIAGHLHGGSLALRARRSDRPRTDHGHPAGCCRGSQPRDPFSSRVQGEDPPYTRRNRRRLRDLRLGLLGIAFRLLRSGRICRSSGCGEDNAFPQSGISAWAPSGRHRRPTQ